MDNSTKPSIPFSPPTSAIPILGQAFKLKGVLPQVLVQCACEAKEPVLLLGMGAQGTCPSCGRLFVLEEVHGVKGGDVSATVGVGVPRPVTEG
jgi:hypothetical protein